MQACVCRCLRWRPGVLFWVHGFSVSTVCGIVRILQSEVCTDMALFEHLTSRPQKTRTSLQLFFTMCMAVAFRAALGLYLVIELVVGHADAAQFALTRSDGDECRFVRCRKCGRTVAVSVSEWVS